MQMILKYFFPKINPWRYFKPQKERKEKNITTVFSLFMKTTTEPESPFI